MSVKTKTAARGTTTVMMKMVEHRAYRSSPRAFWTLKLLELLLGGGALRHLDDVEANGFGERSALADRDRVADGNVAEAGRQMGGNVPVPLLETLVFPDEMKIVSPDDDGALHLELADDAAEDAAADLDQAGEGALLVEVVALLRLHRGLEAEADVLHVADLLGLGPGDQSRFVVQEDVLLLLESSFRLVRHLAFILLLSN